MARFGIEGIRHFGHARAAGVSTAGDLTTRSIAVTVSITSPSQRSIPEPSTGAKRIAGKQTVCDADQGGDDIHWVDDVDIFWIETHENHEADGRARMLHDTPQANWRTYSDQWQLGENWNAE